MKRLIRLALILAVAAAAGLAPAAHAQNQAVEPDPLDTAQGLWSSSDQGSCRFSFTGAKYSLLYGWYSTYSVEHTHADGFMMAVNAIYWHNEKYKGLVTFDYVHGEDRGSGEWILQWGKDGAGTSYRMLVGNWKSKTYDGSGTWSLWRRYVENPR